MASSLPSRRTLVFMLAAAIVLVMVGQIAMLMRRYNTDPELTAGGAVSDDAEGGDLSNLSPHERKLVLRRNKLEAAMYAHPARAHEQPKRVVFKPQQPHKPKRHHSRKRKQEGQRSQKFKLVNSHAKLMPWEHTNNSRRAWQAPLFVDLDNDGALDYVNTYHFGFCSKRAMYTAMTRNRARGTHGNPDTYCDTPWNWGVAVYNSSLEQFSRIHWGPTHFRLLDTMNSGSLFSPDIHVHALSVLDLDRDGRLDLFAQVMMAKAQGSLDDSNVLMWGTGAREGHPASRSTPSFQFSGGHQAALEAGLDYGGANSQHMVWLDANMDGAIDVILFAKPPSEEQSDVIGAELYLSTGYHKRQWTLQKNSTLSELSSTAILTDLDGDGIAREIALWRPPAAHCKADEEAASDSSAAASDASSSAPSTVATSRRLLQVVPVNTTEAPTTPTNATGVAAATATSIIYNATTSSNATTMNVTATTGNATANATSGSSSSDDGYIIDPDTRFADFDDRLWTWWCGRHRQHTIGFYSVTPSGGFDRLDDPEATEPLYHGRPVEEFTSADLDGDGLADLLQLTPNDLIAYPSTLRQPGELPTYNTSITIAQWNVKGCRAVSLVVADFDLNGAPELLIVCAQPGANKLLVQYQDDAKQPRALTRAETEFSVGYDEVPAESAGLEGSMESDAEAPGKLKLAWSGASVADVNNDGFPDLYLAANGASQLLLNTFPQRARKADATLPNFVAIKLVGRASTTEATGATVTLTATGGLRPQVREVRQSRAKGFDDSRIVFGLGKSKIQRVDVRWPNGLLQVILGAELRLNDMAKPNVVIEDLEHPLAALERAKEAAAEAAAAAAAEAEKAWLRKQPKVVDESKLEKLAQSLGAWRHHKRAVPAPAQAKNVTTKKVNLASLRHSARVQAPVRKAPVKDLPMPDLRDERPATKPAWAVRWEEEQEEEEELEEVQEVQEENDDDYDDVDDDDGDGGGGGGRRARGGRARRGRGRGGGGRGRRGGRGSSKRKKQEAVDYYGSDDAFSDDVDGDGGEDDDAFDEDSARGGRGGGRGGRRGRARGDDDDGGGRSGRGGGRGGRRRRRGRGDDDDGGDGDEDEGAAVRRSRWSKLQKHGGGGGGGLRGGGGGGKQKNTHAAGAKRGKSSKTSKHQSVHHAKGAGRRG